MDHGVGTPPAVDSASRDDEHFLDPSSSGTKRKRQLGLPWPKQKLRRRRISSDHRSPATAHHLDPEESYDETLNQAKREAPSCEDGNEFHGLSDDTVTPEVEGRVPMSPMMLVPQYEPSPSPGRVEDVASKDGLHSSDGSRVAKNDDSSPGVLSVAQECADSEEGSQLEAQKKGKSSSHQVPALGVDDGGEPMEECGVEGGGEDGCLDGALQESMPCSNDVGLTTLGLYSGRWSIKQDAFAGRRPTIDQEFEQYFSMFML